MLKFLTPQETDFVAGIVQKSNMAIKLVLRNCVVSGGVFDDPSLLQKWWWNRANYLNIRISRNYTSDEEEISRNYQIAVWVLLVKSRTSWKIEEEKEEEEKEEKQDKERRAHAANNEYIVQEGGKRGKEKRELHSLKCLIEQTVPFPFPPFITLSLFQGMPVEQLVPRAQR